MIIHKEILIEDLISEFPTSVSYLMGKGMKCIACGEPIWGTLESATNEKGFSALQIQNFVNELRALAQQKN
ncbi:MAG: DUF1858 domain-containing protein [Bacteroidota bacterium]